LILLFVKIANQLNYIDTVEKNGGQSSHSD
jgi:hypothetical protein